MRGYTGQREVTHTSTLSVHGTLRKKVTKCLHYMRYVHCSSPASTQVHVRARPYTWCSLMKHVMLLQLLLGCAVKTLSPLLSPPLPSPACPSSLTSTVILWTDPGSLGCPKTSCRDLSFASFISDIRLMDRILLSSMFCDRRWHWPTITSADWSRPFRLTRISRTISALRSILKSKTLSSSVSVKVCTWKKGRGGEGREGQVKGHVYLLVQNTYSLENRVPACGSLNICTQHVARWH